ncbi:uncharacterized protein LACBIDRAFT_192054 [Laccaria bicolor S238N-H82]|uniref:Predicted protein n=1 Tax=Laccaria bicolor (strain S238N-H82 / ATCC MYA-4686) TaxID=486041 RepID=B0DXV1_LACBS|nr:uncharacterized protein LACBIDRAFT_192054 [Laccaria bicolor S238N-H82]EDR00528.1 predicted protein [Laccaria bicolor S238N-H82]|eukprot:XP_001888755.1 predicted protein [Laccaria bicolor S238N-H82]
MSVFHYEPFYDFDRFLEDAFVPRAWTGGEQQPVQRRAIGGSDTTADGAVRALKPRMDLHEDKEKNLVTATFELPGLKKEDIHLEIQNGRLSVSADSKISKDYEEGGYAVRERRYGKFSRTLQLPQGVKDDGIKASMDNGLLTITFPKTAENLAPKKITIS